MKLLYKFHKWEKLFLLLMAIMPIVLTAQNNTQAQQILNKANKSQFFIENKGQWPKQVKFLARLGGMNAWITDSGVVYDYLKINRNYSIDSVMMMHLSEKDEYERTHTSCNGQIIRMDYAGINFNALKQGIDKRETYYNYFIGNDSTKWASFVGLYGEVMVKEAYKGINIRYYFDSGQIRYDYLVNAGADISQINFRLTGANDVAVNENGELIIQTILGEVKHGKLYAYQQYGSEKKEVSCSFERREDGSIGVIASDYEKGLALVIDPLVWSTFIGGADNDIINGIIADKSGCAIATGESVSMTYPCTIGSYSTVYKGNGDAFVTKFNTNGANLVFSTFIGGWNEDGGSSITLDQSGIIYLSLDVMSSDFPTTPGVYASSLRGWHNIAICKLNATGSSLLLSTLIGGNQVEYSLSIIVDKQTNVYVSGCSASSNYPVTSGCFDPSYNGGWDMILTKINSNFNSLVYSTYIGGSGDEDGSFYKPTGMLLDDIGSVTMTGTTTSSNFPTTIGSYSPILKGKSDIFLLKINKTGSALLFSTFIGDTGTEGISSICKSGKDIIICGYTSSPNYPVSSGCYDSAFNGAGDIFISKFDSNATSLLNSTFLGGKNYDTPYNIFNDSNGNILLVGTSSSSDFPTTSNAFDNSFNYGPDVILSIFNNDLTKLIYSSYFGGSMMDWALGSCLADPNFIYIGGHTWSNNFPVTKNAFDPTFNSPYNYRDAFLMKFDICSIKIYPVTGGGGYCIGNSGLSIGLSGSDTGIIYELILDGVATGKKINGTGKSIYWYKNTLLGNYTIQAYKNSVCLEMMSGSVDISYLPAPIVKFIVSDSNQCLDQNLFKFSNQSTLSSGKLNYLWSFGDGDTTSQQNPQHSYLASKSYNVKLVVLTDKNCSDSIIKQVTVLPSPNASFSINDSTQCLVGNNFSFTNKSSVNSGSFSSGWQFGDGNGSVNPNPSHTYAYADTFAVKLVVSSDSGCKDSIINNVIVGAAPKASFWAYDSSQCLERNNFLFSNKSTSTNGSYNCLWNFGDSVTSALLNPMHKYSYANTFTVVLIVTDSMGCKDTFSKKTWVHVHPEPLADFGLNDSSQCLNGNVFVLTNNTTIKSGTFTQKWEFADGFDTASYNANHSYSLVNSYMIKLLVISDWACKDSILKKVYVWPEPKAAFTINMNPQYKSVNKFIFTSNALISSGYLHHFWDFGDGNTDTSINPIHSYLNSGTFLVKLIVTSDYGCADTFYDSAFVLKFTKTNISFSFTNGCVGIPVNFRNTSTVDPPDSFINFIWDFGDGYQTIILEDPKHIYYSPGSYVVTLFGLTAFGNKDTLIDTIEIYPSPTVDITALPDTIAIPGRPITLTAKGIYDQLLWFDSSTLQTVVVQTEGKYWVTATFNNGCKSSDTIELTKGDVKEFEIVTVFTPNGDGINDRFVIKNIEIIQPCKLKIYNRWGDELYSSDNYINNWEGTYKGKTLPEGTYYYVLVTKGGKLYKGAVNILK